MISMNDDDKLNIQLNPMDRARRLDMVKDIEVLEKAYNDRKSITAEFNKNVLNVINSIINVDFNPDDFEHVAFFNSEKQRIEMHLKALENVSVKINDGSSEIFVKKDEMIHLQ